MAKLNSNCLEGMRCPRCKSLGPFKIACTVLATFSDEGGEDHEGHDWGNQSYCECVDCRHESTVADFQIKKPK